LCTIQIFLYELFVGNEDTRYSSLYIPCQDFLAKKFQSSQLPATTNVIYAARLFSSLPLQSHP